MRKTRMALLFAMIGTTTTILAQKTVTLADGVSALAEQVIAGLSGGKQRVAVIPLRTLKGEENMLGAYISEELGTILAAQKVQVIERALLTPLLDELKLNESGAIDPTTAKRVGKLIGADAIITGTIVELPTTLRINCRVIATQTGEVLTGARAVITIDADVQALKDDRVALPGGSVGENDNSDDEPQYSWKRGGIRYVVDGTDRNNSGVFLNLALEHEKSTAQTVSVFRYHLIDEFGDRYDYRRDSEDFVEHGVTIPPGTRARSAFFFISKGSKNGTKFNVVASDGTIVLRDLIIPRKR